MLTPIGALFAAVVLASAGLPVASGVPAAPEGAAASQRLPASQQVAVPAYFDPGEEWDRLGGSAIAVGAVIVNPANGPGSVREERWARQIDAAEKAGLRLLGYVATGYGHRAPRLVQRDLLRWRRWYPRVEGVFLDEARLQCRYRRRFDRFVDFAKRRAAMDVVALNFGDSPARCYRMLGDVVVNFEGDPARYRQWRPKPYERRLPASRFWHLVYGVPEASMSETVGLSKERHARLVYVTPDDLPNPWDTLPREPYWTKQAVRATLPL